MIGKSDEELIGGNAMLDLKKQNVTLQSNYFSTIDSKPTSYRGFSEKNGIRGLSQVKIKQLSHWINKVRFGECPECHVILTAIKGWGFSECGSCGKHLDHF